MSQISVFSGPSSNSDNQLRSQQAQRSNAYDPVDKLRVSTPQSLIDTDFEYGQQATKWEQLTTQNNRQSCYYTTNSPLPIITVTSATTGGMTYAGTTITVFTATPPAIGTPIFIEDSLDPNANGWWLVSSVSAGVSFTYVVTTVPTLTGNLYNTNATYLYTGYFYTNCGIPVPSASTTAIVTSGTAITVTTTYPHGLSAGSLIYIVGTTGGTGVNGAWVVATTLTANTFTIATTGASGTVTTNATVFTIGGVAITNTNIYVRPTGYVDTHAYDGSVNFSVGANVPNAVLLRQTRRYFRYQSGKGIQFSTGTILKPQITPPVITSVGSTVTVTVKFAHNLTVNTYIQVIGADQTAYNGIFKITSVPTLLTFTYVTINNSVPTASPATSTAPNLIHVSPYSWYGCSNRIGFFDSQNGLYFKFDGQTLSAVYRNSVNQISGLISVTQGSSLVTGTNTAFTTQLVTGDYVVIRGQTYRVLTIMSDTSMYIGPEYRGNNSQTLGGVAQTANCVMSRVIDLVVPQSQWWDPLDGTGPSGYVLDLTKVQMFYIDFSWYGAGVARFGIRTTNGAITYVYGFQNNNVNYSAYMRSGNLPSHYEQNNVLPITTITSSLTTASTSVNTSSTAGFNPAGGTARIIGNGTGAAIEYISYTGLSGNSLTGVTRGVAGGAAATAFTYSATAPVAIEYAVPDTAAMLSHWGSSVVMDGGFNNDVSLLFNYGMTTPLATTAAGTAVPIMALRIAPSVDNGQVGTMGLKEIINRLQLQLNEMALLTTTSYLVQFILNGVISGTTNFNTAGFLSPTQNGTTTSSICQVATNTLATATISGGESIAAFFTNITGQTTLSLSTVSPVGNAILGGGINNNVPTGGQAGFFPDGPDILYVVVTQVGSTAGTAQARISWQESQA